MIVSDSLLPLLLILVFLALWILPIVLGIKAARQRNRSPHWMWFGLHPVTGWGAFILLSILPHLRLCTSCGSKAPANAQFCPHCSTALQAARADPVPALNRSYPRFSQPGFYFLIATLVAIIPITIFMVTTMMYTQLSRYYWPSFALMSVIFAIHLVCAAISLKKIGYSPWLSLTGLACGIIPFILYCALPFKPQNSKVAFETDSVEDRES